MKSLMVVAAAALCCAAFAQGPKQAPAPKGKAPAARSAQQGPRNRAKSNGGMQPGFAPGMGDPLIRAVSNPEIAGKIGLSEEQQTKLKEALNDNKALVREKQNKVRKAAMRQVELMRGDKIDESAVMSAIDEIFELRKQIAKEQAKRLIAVKSILTPEQIRKAREEMKAMFPLRGGRGPMRGAAKDARSDRPKAGPRGGAKPAPADKEN